MAAPNVIVLNTKNATQYPNRGDDDADVGSFMVRHVGLGGQNFAERGQSPGLAPEISPIQNN
eukprot:scaffold110210_cov36-Cyclotella_meneghiniana.AAC.3